MKRILVLGKRGYISTCFQTYMKNKDGYSIDVISVRGDSWREKSFSNYDAIFNTIGLAHNDARKGTDEQFIQLNVNLISELAQKAKTDGCSLFVHMSSMIVYGSLSPLGVNKKYTADTIPTPNNIYGRSKLMGENEILKLQSENFNVAIIRSPLVYGENAVDNFEKLVSIAKKLPVFPDIKNERSMIYADNLCELVKLIVENDSQGIFYPQQDEYIRTSKLVKDIAVASGHKMIITSLFNPLIYLLSKKMIFIRKVFGSLAYDMEISNCFDGKYRVVDYKESIKRIVDSKHTKKKICLASASGGHFEQLCKLKPLLEKYDGFIVTEKTKFSVNADYCVTQTGFRDQGWIQDSIKLFREVWNICKKEKPDVVISTGTYIALPFMLYCKIHQKKLIYIETFARVTDTTKAGRMMYKFADLFIYQWPELKKYYPKGIYGGSIY
jgi:UDP-glucose 4-epimerase